MKSSLDYIPTSILANLVGSYVYLPGMPETAFKKKKRSGLFTPTYKFLPPLDSMVPQNTFPWRILSHPSLLSPPFP